MTDKYRAPPGTIAGDGPKIRHGAVIVFKNDADAETCQRFLDKLFENGVLEHESSVHEYDANWGGPVWYLP